MLTRGRPIGGHWIVNRIGIGICKSYQTSPSGAGLVSQPLLHAN